MSEMEMFFISGLPRSGSTLLTSILSQNPDFYTSGNSPLCQMMWDLEVSINFNCNEQFAANNLLYKKDSIISSISHSLYSDVKEKYIFDKCRSWTIPENIDIIKKYITKNFKILVLIRDIEDILKSFINISKDYNYEKTLFIPGSDPLMRSLYGVYNCITNLNSDNYLIINYNSLISNTDYELKRIYSFLNLKNFNHNLENIVNKNKEDDSAYGIEGLHEVRQTISKNQYSVNINEKSKNICYQLNKYIKDFL